MVLLRQVLGYRISVESLIEIAMWLSIPYLAVGLVFTFVHADYVDQLQVRLQTQLPAGADLVAFGVTTVLWPVLMAAPAVCGLA